MLVVTYALVACTGSVEPAPATDPTTPTEEVVDTGWAPGDFAAWQIWNNLETGDIYAGAIAVQTTPGFSNLAECALDPSRPTCLPPLPKGDGNFVTFVPDTTVDLSQLRTRFLGEVTYGPFDLELVQDEDSQAIGYLGPASYLPVTNTAIGPSWTGGDWPGYVSHNELSVSTPMELVQPAAGSRTTFTNGQNLVVEWVPRGGIVTLAVVGEGWARLYRLDDDGLFALDVDTLPWIGFVEDVHFELRRWDHTEIQRFGNVNDLLVTSSVAFEGRYFEVGPREPLEPADTCQPATGMLSLPAGQWWWGYEDLDDTVGFCGDDGPDAIYRVDLPPRTLLTVEHTARGAISVLGLSTRCPAEPGTCEDVVTGGFNQPAFANHFNLGDQTQSIYVFADTQLGLVDEPQYFTLDVQIDELSPPELFDRCVDIPAGARLSAGLYYSEFTAFANDLNPSDGGCTDKSAPGADAMAPITVPAGQTLTVGIQMPGGDPSLYLLRNCNDVFQCEAGADLHLDGNESLAHTNGSNVDQDLFLVIDSANGLRPYFLSVRLD